MKNNSTNQQNDNCIRCNTNQQLFISLQCQHNYCLVCISYLFIKSKASGKQQDQILCSICNKITKLNQSSIEAIHTTIQQTLLPNLPKSKSNNDSIQELSAENINQQPYQHVMFHQEIQDSYLQKDSKNKNQCINQNESVNKYNLQKIKKVKRYSSSSSNHITPSTKYFFSKCDSPIQKDKLYLKQYCQIHNLQQISFVCLTCQNLIVCLSCVMSMKHKDHNIKDIKKGMQYLNDEITMKKLQINEKIQYYEMWQRRLNDKRQQITYRWQKDKQNVSQYCEKLVNKIKKKQMQLIELCNEQYHGIKQSTLKQQQKLKIQLNKLKNTQENFKILANFQKEYFNQLQTYNFKVAQYFNFYNKISRTIQDLFTINYVPELNFNQHTFCTNIFQKKIIMIIDLINQLTINYNKNLPLSARLPTTTEKNVNNFMQKNRKNKKIYTKTQQNDVLHQQLANKYKKPDSNNLSNSSNNSKHNKNNINLHSNILKINKPRQGINLDLNRVTTAQKLKFQKQQRSYDKTKQKNEKQDFIKKNKRLTLNSTQKIIQKNILNNSEYNTAQKNTKKYMAQIIKKKKNN